MRQYAVIVVGLVVLIGAFVARKYVAPAGDPAAAQQDRERRTQALQSADQQVWGWGYNFGPRVNWKISDEQTLSLGSFFQKGWWNNRTDYDNQVITGRPVFDDDTLQNGTWENQRANLTWVNRFTEDQRIELKAGVQRNAWTFDVRNLREGQLWLRAVGGGDDKGQGGSCFSTESCFSAVQTVLVTPVDDGTSCAFTLDGVQNVALEPEDRALVLLRHVHDVSYAELSETFGVKEGATALEEETLEGGFAVDESGGEVLAFGFDPQTAAFTARGKTSTLGAGPAHVSVSPGGGSVLVANYGGGSVAVFPVLADGSLGAASDTKSPGAKAHQIITSASGAYAFVPCLGANFIAQYSFAGGKLTANSPATVSPPAGAGPRHLAFVPSQKWALGINETASSMTSYAYDSASGKLTAVRTACEAYWRHALATAAVSLST